MKMRKIEREKAQKSTREAPASYYQIRWIKENSFSSFEEFKKVFPEASLAQYRYCISML